MQETATTTWTSTWTVRHLRAVQRLQTRNVLWVSYSGGEPSEYPEDTTPPALLKLGPVEVYCAALNAALDSRDGETLYAALRSTANGILVTAVTKPEGSVYTFSPNPK